MVDAEPIADNSEICRSIASIDESRIVTTAIIESGTIIGYYYNGQSMDMWTEEEHNVNSRLQAVVRNAATKLSLLSAESSDVAGQMLHFAMHGNKLDLIVFPMPYAGSPKRILVIASKASDDYDSLIRAIQSRLEQMKA